MVNLFLRETNCLYEVEVRIPPRIPADFLRPLRQLVPMIAQLPRLNTIAIQSSIDLIFRRISADMHPSR